MFNVTLYQQPHRVFESGSKSLFPLPFPSGSEAPSHMPRNGVPLTEGSVGDMIPTWSGAK